VKSLVFIIVSIALGGLYSIQGSADTTSAKVEPSGIGTREADDSVRIIGTLPYSNQWTFERPSNYLYINLEQATLASQAIVSSTYESDYSSNKINLISLDYFSKLFDLANPLGDSFFRRFAFWGRYRVGFGLLSGTVMDDSTSTVLPAEKSSLLITGASGFSLTLDSAINLITLGTLHQPPAQSLRVIIVFMGLL
jgi:hypothetical protein